MTDELTAGGRADATAQRAHTLPGQRLVNRVVRVLLRSPGLCRVVGDRLVTLYLVGRTSGRRYAIPVAYLRDGRDLLIGTSFAWGRNLRAGDTAAIRLKGRRMLADVSVATAEAEVVQVYERMARLNPTFARLGGIGIGADGEPDSHDLHLAWLGGARVITLTPR